jgi:hypothetical protein
MPGLSELTMVDHQKEAEKEKEADVEEMAGEGTHDQSLEPAALADRTIAAVEENVGSEGKEGEQVEEASGGKKSTDVMEEDEGGKKVAGEDDEGTEHGKVAESEDLEKFKKNRKIQELPEAEENQENEGPDEDESEEDANDDEPKNEEEPVASLPEGDDEDDEEEETAGPVTATRGRTSEEFERLSKVTGDMRVKARDDQVLTDRMEAEHKMEEEIGDEEDHDEDLKVDERFKMAEKQFESWSRHCRTQVDCLMHMTAEHEKMVGCNEMTAAQKKKSDADWQKPKKNLWGVAIVALSMDNEEVVRNMHGKLCRWRFQTDHMMTKDGVIDGVSEHLVQSASHRERATSEMAEEVIGSEGHEMLPDGVKMLMELNCSEDAGEGGEDWKPWIHLAKSKHFNGGIGVFAARVMEKGTFIGPHVGREVWRSDILWGKKPNAKKVAQQRTKTNRAWSLCAMDMRNTRGRMVQKEARPIQRHLQPDGTLASPMTEVPLHFGMHHLNDPTLTCDRKKGEKEIANAARMKVNCVQHEDGVVMTTKKVEKDAELLMNHNDPDKTAEVALKKKSSVEDPGKSRWRWKRTWQRGRRRKRSDAVNTRKSTKEGDSTLDGNHRTQIRGGLL